MNFNLFKPMKEDTTSVYMKQKEDIINMAKETAKKEMEALKFPEPPVPESIVERIKANQKPEPIEQPQQIVYGDQYIINQLEIIISNQAIIYNAVKKLADAANIKLE